MSADTRDIARRSLLTALDRHVDEPTLVAPDGRRWAESELQHLHKSGALGQLEELAPAAEHFLRVIEAARHPAHGPAYQVMYCTGLGWGDDPPPGTRVLLPAGWNLITYHYPFGLNSEE